MKPIFSLRGLAPSALAAACAAFAGSVLAQAVPNNAADNQATLAVRATIADKCRVESPTSSIAWTIDPASTTESISPTADVRFKCTKGFKFAVKLGGDQTQSAFRELKRGNDKITYTLHRSAPDSTDGRGFGDGNDIVVKLHAKVPKEQYQNAASGLYADDVQIVIEP